jgi:superfamily II DNA or RNA helicase
VKLRDYQLDAIGATVKAWEGGDERVLLTLATGLGKTIIFAKLAQMAVQAGKGRALVIAPSIELVGQAAAKIEQVTGERPAIEQASHWSNEVGSVRSNYIVSCKASLVSQMRDGRKRYQRLQDVGLVVVDEAHYSGTPDYREILDHFDCLTLGLTATPRRHDGVSLEGVYGAAPFVMGIREGIDNGWLVGPETHCLQLQSLDLTTVRSSKGDFVQSALGKVMEGDDVVFEVAAATAAESDDRKTIVFCASIDQAMKTAQVLKEHHGMKADWVCGDKARCPDATRESILHSFTRDPAGIQTVCNVGVLTTGFDFPGLRHIVMARPTKSTPLFTQIFGRGTRALDGVVDFDGSTPETRREAIAASGKPKWKFTDLRDTSLKHKLVTPVDVLGGKHSVEVLERAKAMLNEAEEARDLDDLLDQAQRHVREEELIERARLAKLHAEAEFSRVTIDPFLDAFRVTHASDAPKERGARMPYGKYKGQLVRDVPKDYLAWMQRNNKISAAWLRQAVAKTLNTVEAVA